MREDCGCSCGVRLAQVLPAKFAGRAADRPFEEMAERKGIAEADGLGDAGNGMAVFQEHGGRFVDSELLKVL